MSTERIDWKGSVVCPLNTDEAKEAIKGLVDEGVESIAVCLLWSFSNPVHEKELKKIYFYAIDNFIRSLPVESLKVERLSGILIKFLSLCLRLCDEIVLGQV